MATIGSVALTQPTVDPNIAESGSFTMGGQVTKLTHGGVDYDMYFEWDQGLGDSDANYTTIPSSGNLQTADTNPVLASTSTGELTITVTGTTAGSYFVRIRTVDNNDGGAEDKSSTQAVTVTAASTRRIFVT
jgi:hypothetical protein